MMAIRTVLRRGLVQRRGRTAGTALVVGAAVAFLSGTFVLTDTIDAGVRRSAAPAAGTTTVIVTAAAPGGSLLVGAPTLPDALVSQIAQVPGVAAAAGITAGYAMPLTHDGTPVAATAGIGVSIPADPRLRLLTLRAGTWPSGPQEIVVDATTAATLAAVPGSTMRVALPSGVRTFTLTGTVGFGSAANLVGLSMVGFVADAAPALLGADTFAAIEVASTPGVPAETVAARIRGAVGSGYDVRTATEQAAQISSAVAGVISIIGTVLAAFATIALIVAAMLIANVFTITVAQRARELALLRCVGASRSQIGILVLAEATMVGLAGGVAGLAGGIAVAGGLKAVLGALGLPLPAGPSVVEPRTIIVAIAVGVGVTGVAASAASLRAARSRPLAALSTEEQVASPRRLGWIRRVIAVLAVLAGGSLLSDPSGSPASVGLGAVALLVGAGLGAVALVRPLTAPGRRLASAVLGVGGELAGRNMVRQPRRVVGTAGTLTVAVATVAIVAALAATFSASSANTVRQALHADYVITTPSGAGLDPLVRQRIAALPGVTATIGLPCGRFQPPGGNETVCGIDPAGLPGMVDLDVVDGRLADLTAGTIAISARVAARTGWRLGQSISIGYPLGGSRSTRIVALFAADDVVGSFLIPRGDYAQSFSGAQQTDATILVTTAAGPTAPADRDLTQLLHEYPQATLADKDSFAHQVSSGIDVIATLATALLTLSLLIGLIAVVTALALSVLERTREIGLLRAIGAHTRQIRTIIRAEALVATTTGALIGLGLGTAIGWPLARAIDVYLTGGPAIPVLLLIIILPAAIVTGLLAAAVPARRAARLNTLTAIHTE
jgi:putative ABC transport system permease protein